jgi:phage gpG-like protein
MALTVEVKKNGNLWIGKTKTERVRVGASHAVMIDTMEKVLDYILEANRTHFNTRGHGSWPPLDEETLIRKRRDGFSSRILRRTDRLFESLTSPAGAKDRDVDIDEDRLNFSSTVPYGGVHEKGSRKKGIPKRKPMELTERQEKHITRIIRKGMNLGS